MTDYNNGQDPACEHCGMDPTADANRIEALIAERDEAYRLFAFWRAESDRLTEQLAAAQQDAKEAEAYAEELEKELDAFVSGFGFKRDQVLEAKLAKAVKAIEARIHWSAGGLYCNCWKCDPLVTTLAEIKGESHD